MNGIVILMIVIGMVLIPVSWVLLLDYNSAALITTPGIVVCLGGGAIVALKWQIK